MCYDQTLQRFNLYTIFIFSEFPEFGRLLPLFGLNPDSWSFEVTTVVKNLLSEHLASLNSQITEQGFPPNITINLNYELFTTL